MAGPRAKGVPGPEGRPVAGPGATAGVEPGVPRVRPTHRRARTPGSPGRLPTAWSRTAGTEGLLPP